MSLSIMLLVIEKVNHDLFDDFSLNTFYEIEMHFEILFQSAFLLFKLALPN